MGEQQNGSTATTTNIAAITRQVRFTILIYSLLTFRIGCFLGKVMAYADGDGYDHLSALGEYGSSASDVSVRSKGDPHLHRNPRANAPSDHLSINHSSTRCWHRVFQSVWGGVFCSYVHPAINTMNLAPSRNAWETNSTQASLAVLLRTRILRTSSISRCSYELMMSSEVKLPGLIGTYCPLTGTDTLQLSYIVYLGLFSNLHKAVTSSAAPAHAD